MLLRRVARWVARIRAPLAVKLQAAFALLCALLLATGLAGVFIIARLESSPALTLSGITLIAIGSAAILSSVLARSIVAPIREVDAALQEIARGEFTRGLDVANGDELGALLARVNGVGTRLAGLSARERQATQQLEEQFATLRRAQGQLVQSEKRRRAEKLQALGEMAGGVAHDFNNLLAVVLGQAELLLNHLDRKRLAPDDARRRLEVIAQAALDGAETVRRLLEFTRATPQPTPAEAVQVNALFTAVVAAARPRWKDEADAQGRHIEVVTDFDTLPPILANAAEVREVLLNLIFNALDAMPGGGTLSLSTRAEGGEIHVAVTDTGVGMPEDVAARIFEPFFTTKGPQASGLGLSVSYGIVRRHGGDLTVDSRPGKGTTFTVSLPIRDVPPPDTGGTGAAPAGTLGLRVLVIDDEDSVRQVLRDLLLRDGHQVWEASTGEAGIGSLEYQPVDLVCTDLGMPGMTGLEVADRVRAKWPGVKVALVTGWGARVEPADLRAHGIDFLLAKPFRTDDVRRMLAQVGRDSAAGAVGAASVSRP